MRNAFIGCVGLLLVAGCDFIGGGDTIVRGDGNLVVKDEVGQRVASALARFDSTPAVTDEDIEAVFAVIRERALAGELEASLVLLKVAEKQREAAEEAAEEAGE